MYTTNINSNRPHMDGTPVYRSANENRPINEENFYTEIPFQPTPLSSSLKDRLKEVFQSIRSSRSSSTQFYMSVNPNYASYEEIDLPPPLPPRNGLQGNNIDDNPIYMSADEIYEPLGPPSLPSRVRMERLSISDNPNYVSIDTPPVLPPRDLHFHTRFLNQIRNLE